MVFTDIMMALFLALFLASSVILILDACGYGFPLSHFILKRICRCICRIRGHHNWEWRSYGGLGGTYSVKRCSCCDARDDGSFTPEETY